MNLRSEFHPYSRLEEYISAAEQSWKKFAGVGLHVRVVQVQFQRCLTDLYERSIIRASPFYNHDLQWNRIAILHSFDHSKYCSSSRSVFRVAFLYGPSTGVGASFLKPFCLALSNFSISLLLPLTCEVAHNIAGRLLYSEGNLKIEGEIHNALNWTVVEFGIRCFSLNFCGKFNHLFDTLRRCLAPFSAGRSGRMIHDVVVVHIEDSQTGYQAFVLFSKTHNGDMEVKYCRDLNEVDDKGRPRVFGRPPCGWWKQRTKSRSLILKDVLEEFMRIPAQYQPVTNNCHHFSKDLWNWHDARLNEGLSKEDKDPFITSKVHIIRGSVVVC